MTWNWNAISLGVACFALGVNVAALFYIALVIPRLNKAIASWQSLYYEARKRVR